MKEQQMHNALMAWLKKHGVFYVHAAFGKKSTMTKDAPDFVILHCNRALLIELKTEKGGLTAGQKKLFAQLQTESGMVVHVARSVEQAVCAVQDWMGIETWCSAPVERENESPVPPANGLFILTFAGRDAVFSGDPSPGGQIQRVRIATASDLTNLPRR